MTFILDFFSSDIFPETLQTAPIFFWEKKAQETKTRDFISSDILS